MRALHAAIFLTGFVAFGYEVVLQSAAVTVLGSGTLAMGIVISAFILGYTTGRPLGALADRLDLRANLVAFALLELAAALLMLASLVLVRQAHDVAEVLAAIWPLALLGDENLMVLAVGLAAALAPMCMGGEIPIAIKASAQADPQGAQRVGTLSGRIWSLDAAGAAIGGLATALWIVPAIGKGAAMLGLAALALAAAGLALVGLRPGRRADAGHTEPARDPSAVRLPTSRAAPRGRAWRVGAMAVAAAVCLGTLAWAAVSPGTLRAQVEGEVLHVEHSRHAEIVVTDHPVIGRTLWLDGQLQVGELDEYQYHEALVHPAMALVPDARSVAVLGGGDGGALREVLRYPVERVTVVDLDPAVTRVTLEWLPMVPGASFSDPRATLVATDAWSWLRAQSPGSLDLVIVDLPDPTFDGAALLYTQEFYRDVRDRLAPAGVVVTQAGSLFTAPQEVASVKATLASVFGEATVHASMVWSFGTWGFASATNGAGSLERLPEGAAQRAFSSMASPPDWYRPGMVAGFLALAATPGSSAPAAVLTVDHPIRLSAWYQARPAEPPWPTWVAAVAAAGGIVAMVALGRRLRHA